ncbi:hypothetical protein AA103196_1947 [Ameyamaea chiangmaiensis NBRC 103196]|uniref:DUF3597 domain-containing protein n=1 Tax=Ameyamaea chiangmaiensis TaxID=442969 RepID=A0A850PA65_9PROT|nr:DUF3597 domain-containing protein [Ameyamaea chiangmaiensis]MBS4073788.1 DUF3597 domain-containing protein [Ameyamaea chiangmaiensis]NVN39216.1 DUF3597 domain-containing protein [Ameyamaea chiangmaiensis]GBQ68448.1 hypothetical protein AA103196_1947 [Ameyamaea chiangmaiensis NBRC 103196]
MSIFGSIVSALFGHANAATTAAPGSAPAAATPSAAPAAATPTPVDVDAVLNGLAAKSGQTLNWKESIVDLLKLLGLDSSLTARQQLATELHYTGDKNDTATMNVWLIKEVRQKLADNNGTFPNV